MTLPEFRFNRSSAAFAAIAVSSLTILKAGAAAPVAYDDVIAGKADTQFVLDYLLLNDTDADGNPLNITAVGAPAHGVLTPLGGNSYRYTPTAGYAGRDTFTYTVADGTGGTDSGLVTVSVNASYDLEAARTAILAGVTQIADPTQPGYMALWGPTAASISNYPGESENHSMIATATLGAGRVVAMPDHQWLVMNNYAGQFNTGTFYENAITWAAGTSSKTVPIVTIDSNVATWLTARGYTQVVTTTAAGLPAALANADVCIPGWLGNNPSAALMTAVTDFASTGNALIICDYSPGYAWWWGKSKWDIPGSKILREAGIGFAEDGYEGGPFTINRANDQMTLDTVIAILNNSTGYSQNLKDLAAATLTQLSQCLNPNDIAYARLLASYNGIIGTITPTPQNPITDSLQRALLDFECGYIAKLAPASMTPHRAALPVSAAAPRVTNASFALTSPPAGHSEKTIYTPFYAAPGELVTITFPAALTTLNLDVRTSHLRSGSGQGSYPVMPVQMINRDVTSTSVQVANPHGGLIQIIVPSNVTWAGTQNITVTGAVQAPYFKLGTTTDAQWVAGIRDRGTPFGVIDSPETTLVVDADKWLRTLADPEAVITEWNYFCGKLREFYNYNAGRQLPVHHDYYPAGGVSTFPQSYSLTDEITHSLNLKSSAYSLTLHEYGHICDSGNLHFQNFGETCPNMGGKWIQETTRKYAWKQELTVGRINNFLWSQADDLWTPEAHHAVSIKGTPFDVLVAEFGANKIKDIVWAISAMASLSTDQAKLDAWVVTASNQTGFNLAPFFAMWQLDASATALSQVDALPDWMPIERAPESLTLVQNSTAIFTNPAGNDFSYDGGLALGSFSTPAHGTVTNNGNGTWTYTPAAGYTGADSFTYSVTNTTGNVFTSPIPVRVVAAANDPKLAAFDGVAKGGTWTTVTLEKSYTSMVVVAKPLAAAGAPPLASRIRNASGSSFEVRLDRLDGSATPVGPTGVRFLVVESGVYNETTHGIKMEAVKFNSTVTDRAGSFTGSTRNYAYTGYDHYFAPAVFGQVMTSNDPGWSAFWFDPFANNIRVGKHVGEDTDTTRADETVGYIVMESGSYQFGNSQLQVGVSNVDEFPGFELIGDGGGSHTFTRFPAIHSAQISASIDVPWGGADAGQDGFVAMQATAGGNTLSGYLTEDSFLDAERATGTKSTAYLLAHRSDGAPFSKADQTLAIAGKQTLIDVTGNDEISGVPVVTVTQPANGSVVVHTDGKLIYTPNIGYTGSDPFTYTVNNGSGSTTAPVFVQVIATAAVQAGITADRFNSITGGSISNLTSSANYPNNPSTRTTWTTASSGQNVGDNLGHRIYGVVVPPTTGDYTFWIASDDHSRLSLSSDTNSANAAAIASVSGWTGYQSWDENSAQKSAVRTLTGGKAYYLEILHKEGGGGDHVSVAWQGPGFARKLLATPDIYTAGENAPLLVAAPSNATVNEGAAPTLINLAGVFSSTDPGDPLTLAIHGNSNPALVGIALNGNQLTLTYPSTGSGTATITLRATDRTGTLVTTSFTVTVNNVNSAPVFTTDPVVKAAATEDSAYSGSLAGDATDPDLGDALTFTKLSGPAWLSVAPNGALSGTPSNANVGANSFTVRVADGAGLTDEATLSIAVGNVNDAPVFTVNPITGVGATQDLAYSASIASYGSDVDAGDTLTYTKESGPAWLNVAPNGALSGTPGALDGGLNGFTVKVTDAIGANATATLNITVTITITNGVWTNLAGGAWPATGNWSGGVVPNGADRIADFSTLNLTANATVTLDGARTIGSMTFGDTTPSHNWTLNPGTGGPLTLAVASGSPVISVANQTTTVGAVLAGNQGLIKSGAGTLTLTGVNAYTGGSTVSGGTLQLGDGVSNGSINGPYSIAAGSNLRLARSVKTTVTNNSLTGAGTVSLFVAGTSNGSGTYQWDTFSTFDTNFTGKLVVEEGRVSYTGAQLGGTSAVEIQNGAQLLAWGTGSPTYNAAISIAGFGWGESGYGNGGLRFAANSGTATWAGPITLAADSGIFCQRGNTTATTFNITGSIAGNFQCQFYAGDPSASTGSTINVAPAAAVRNSYGSTRIDGPASGSGVITAGNPYAFSTGGLTIAKSTLKLNGHSFDFANLTGTGGTLGNYGANASTLTVGSDDTNTISSTPMVNGGTGTLAFTKVGAGTLTLTGANTYTGATSINAGTLLVDGSLGTTDTTVNAAGTLAGGGTLAGAVTVNGTLAPGNNGVGNLTINNALTLGGTTAVELNKTATTLTNDRVQGLTAVTYGGILNVTASGDALAAGDTFTLFTATSYAGSFTDLNLPALGTGLAWNTSQLGVNGTVSVVPATYILTYNAGANGMINGTTPQTVAQSASGTAVTAMPNTGHHFVNWSDGSTSNPRTDANVTADLTVTANFALNSYTLAYNAGANGTISGTTPQTVNHGASGTSVTAIADSGHAFEDWSDGSTANPRTDANVSINLTVTANFTATGPGPLPTPWTAGKIGTVSAAVDATHLGGTFNVTGGGTRIANTSDNFYFVSQPWSGNCTITARVASQQNTGTAAKAGVMIRESTASGSRSVFIGLTPSSGAQWVRRSNTGGNSSTTTSAGKTAPYWVRLTRSGNTFTSYISVNGTSWTQLASVSISMANSYSLGLATCSGASGTPNASVFDNLSVSSTVTAPAAPLAPATLPTMGQLTLEEDTASFHITGEANSTWLLLESTDFATWTPIQTVTLIDGTIEHSEADDRGPRRFFRLQANP